jgi:hypothetical protein
VLGKSGVTCGGGVDLGQWSEAQLRQRRVPDAIIEQVRPYLGVRGDDAVEILRHRPLNMSREDASTLTECIRSDILDDLVRRYDAASDRPFRYLDQQAQTVIASIAFQFGTDLAKATPRFWRQVDAARLESRSRQPAEFRVCLPHAAAEGSRIPRRPDRLTQGDHHHAEVQQALRGDRWRARCCRCGVRIR